MILPAINRTRLKRTADEDEERARRALYDTVIVC
jgi:hypothetical protein